MSTRRIVIVPLFLLSSVLSITTGLFVFGPPIVLAAERACKVTIAAVQQQLHKRAHHSAKTLAAWAAWRKAHPNYHPHPRSRADIQRLLDFVCASEMPIEPSQLSVLLEPTSDTGVPTDDSPLFATSQEVRFDSAIRSSNEELAGLKDSSSETDGSGGPGFYGGGWGFFPGVPGGWGPPGGGPPVVTPPPPPIQTAQTPEPSTLFLLGTGLLGMAAGLRGKAKK